MLGKKSRPVIGILTGSLVSGNKTALLDVTTSPRSQTQSSKGPKNFDFGGVGLGIVAALEMSCDGQSDVSVLFSRKLSRSNPISVTSSKKIPFRNKKSLDEVKRESLEVYTIVTRHVPNKSYTEVYSNGRRGHNSSPFRIQSKRASIFHISPVRCGETTGVPGSDFLSSCHLCQKKLHGEDIYMYRGEKAFCSIECRYRQIVMDEHKDKCSSKAVDVSTSPYANEHIFTTGILAI